MTFSLLHCESACCVKALDMVNCVEDLGMRKSIKVNGVSRAFGSSLGRFEKSRSMMMTGNGQVSIEQGSARVAAALILRLDNHSPHQLRRRQ